MRTLLLILMGSMMSVIGLPAAEAQTAPESTVEASPPMTFFVTSVSPGFGGNLGGLAGADRHCQALAASTRSPEVAARTWRAYLSTSAFSGQPAVNARDRIGKGPWYSSKGVMIAASVSDLHGDTLEAARIGNRLNMWNATDEHGQLVNYVGGPAPLRHDILTGSKPDGTAYEDGKDHTCKNWTSSMEGSARVGHHDRNGASSTSWNSAHESLGCSPGLLQATGSGGLLYCFAID